MSLNHIFSKLYPDLTDMGNSPSNLPNRADIVKTAAYKAAAKKVKLVIEFKENSIDVPDVSDEIFQCLQAIDEWRKLLYVSLYFPTSFNC